MSHRVVTGWPQLFVDRRDIESVDNVTRTFHAATRHRRHPVLTQEAPWERPDLGLHDALGSRQNNIVTLCTG